MQSKSGTIYDILNEYFNLNEDGISVLEQQIDPDTQTEYFEYSRKHENSRSDDEIIREMDLIFLTDTPIDQKKRILVQMATVDNIKAYRTLEKYLRLPHTKLHSWAYLALQESRLLLESRILEENKVLISTGLGGKGINLRYFIVFFSAQGKALTPLNQKIIKHELDYALHKTGGEIEDVYFEGRYALTLTTLPMHIPVQDTFNKILSECNQYGNFLFNDYIITNVKVLSLDEIREILVANDIV